MQPPEPGRMPNRLSCMTSSWPFVPSTPVALCTGYYDHLGWRFLFPGATLLGGRGLAQANFTTLDNIGLKRTSGPLGETNSGAAMRDGTKSKLAAVSTATLTTVLFKRGPRNPFMPGIHRINPGAPPRVGPAYTLRYIPAREDLDHLGVFEDCEHPQRKGVEECPPGHVFVIDSRRNPAAASAGNILVTRLWKRGAAG